MRQKCKFNKKPLCTRYALWPVFRLSSSWAGAAQPPFFGQLFGQYKTVIDQMGGVVVIMFGLATPDIIRVPWFYSDSRPESCCKTATFASSALMGLFFAPSWSPCISATAAQAAAPLLRGAGAQLAVAYQVVQQNLETWLARRSAGGLDAGAGLVQ